jgi:hypothetical protein
MHQETEMFGMFQKASADAVKSQKSRRRLVGLKHSNGDGEGNEEAYFDALLILGVRVTELLTEAKEIRDELLILQSILEQQVGMFKDMTKKVLEGVDRSMAAERGIVEAESRSQIEVLENDMKRLERIDNRANRIYASVMQCPLLLEPAADASSSQSSLTSSQRSPMHSKRSFQEKWRFSQLVKVKLPSSSPSDSRLTPKQGKPLWSSLLSPSFSCRCHSSPHSLPSTFESFLSRMASSLFHWATYPSIYVSVSFRSD